MVQGSMGDWPWDNDLAVAEPEWESVADSLGGMKIKPRVTAGLHRA